MNERPLRAYLCEHQCRSVALPIDGRCLEKEERERAQLDNNRLKPERQIAAVVALRYAQVTTQPEPLFFSQLRYEISE